jgi:hypothetical protein
MNGPNHARTGGVHGIPKHAHLARAWGSVAVWALEKGQAFGERAKQFTANGGEERGCLRLFEG